MKIDITTNNPSGIIENVNCGGNAPIEFTATNIDGYYGVTCWYSTDKSDWLNGTTCIGRTQSKTFTAHVEMPKTGTDTQSVYIVCRDYGYWDLGGYHDSCHSSYDWAYSSYVNGYPDKVTNCYINGAKDADCIATKTLTLSCSSLDFSINSNKNDVSLFCGESATATITVSNNFEDDIQCEYQATGEGLSSSGNIGVVGPGSYKQFSLAISAPATCNKKSFDYNVDVSCKNTASGLEATRASSISISYEANPCIAALNDANNMIKDSDSEITKAETKINEASAMKIDVTSAHASLTQANSKLSSAQTKYSTAQTSCNSGDKTNGVSQANDAKALASESKSFATTALNAAQQSITDYEKTKTEAGNKISSSGSAIDNAKKSVKEAESLINNATIIGMDTTGQEGDLASARSKLKSAEDYYSEATSAFDASNYELAKTRSSSSEAYAKEAESLASDAYNALWTTYSKKRVAAEAISSADTEVSQMIEINTKMAYVLRNMEGYGVDIVETKSISSQASEDTDMAEDLLAQAKNRITSGYTDDAATLAVQARDKAAASRNRLDTIVLNLKFGIQDALNAAYAEKSSLLEQAKASVRSASETYGSDSDRVIQAQEALSAAQKALDDAKSKMNLIDSSETMNELLSNAQLSYEGLDNTKVRVAEAVEKADAAKMAMYQTVAAGGAFVAAAGGGGFLYWRKKKTKVSKVSKKETKPKKHKEKQENHCKKCGEKIADGQKFCASCGKKVKE